MSLGNFSLPFQLATPSPYLYTPNDPHRVVNNLRLNAVVPSSVNIQQERRYQNEPYIPPSVYQQNQKNHQLKQQDQQQYKYQQPQEIPSQTNQYVDYGQDYQRTLPRQSTGRNPQLQQEILPPPLPLPPSTAEDSVGNQDNYNSRVVANQQATTNQNQDPYPERPEGFTRVNGGSVGSPGAKTSVHAVLDYDDDGEGTDDTEDYYDENIPQDARVTPIQGPIYLKNGSVPVVPLYSYPQLQNGSFVQIPILWTALSVALGVELRGDLVRGTPCIKKNHQLFCPTAGNKYPTDRIEQFIDENKALMKRMYGDFEMDGDHGPETSSSPRRRKKRMSVDHDLPDGGPRGFKEKNPQTRTVQGGDSYFDTLRTPRQSFVNNRSSSDSGRIDACESKVEIVTPYWASNSAGKIRAIVNTQHFEQAIHQEVCSKTQTNRCVGECGCEQKYKWHRLLAYDPDNDCKGIFMDWFLFPSCCVCRCDPRGGKFPGTSATTTNTNQRG